MTKIQLRHDTKANFEQVNPVLLVGEAAVETDTGKFKLGNGTDNYTTLPYTYAIPNLELPLEYKPKTKAYQGYGSTDKVADSGNYYWGIAGIDSPIGFDDGFKFRFSYSGPLITRIYFYDTVEQNGTPIYFQFQYRKSSSEFLFQVGPTGTGAKVTQSSVSLPNPAYFEYYFNPIAKKASLNIYSDLNYTNKVTGADFDVTDSQVEYWELFKSKTSLGITSEKTSSSSGNVTCNVIEAIPATVTTPYEEDTLIVNKATNTTPGIVQPDNETIGIENGLLTVIDGDPGGTLRTQLNGIQTQVTSLENNKVNINADNLSTTGKANITNLSFPSNRYVDLTLGASGDNYTAPADGWFCLNAKTTSTDGRIELHNIKATGGDLAMKSKETIVGRAIVAYVPFRKNSICSIYYADIDTNYFRFIYSEGN